MTFRLGVQLPEVERHVPWSEYAAIARAAEESGFDSLWVGDHLLYRDDGREERGPWDAWTLLAALAVATERVRLGPLVACTGFASAGLLARKAAAVQEVSGGRLILGLGAGWNEAEFQAFDVPFDRRASRFLESFDVVQRLLVGERVRYDGEFVQLRDAVVLPRPATPIPLMVGSTGDRVLRNTLGRVDGWNIWFDWYGNTPEGFAAQNDRVSVILEELGRGQHEVFRSATVFVALDGTTGDRPHADVRPVTGTHDEITEQLRAFRAAGVEEMVLVLSPITEATVRRLRDVVDAVKRS